MMFIPGNYVPLTGAVVEAFAIRHSEAISSAGLKPDEAKEIAAHWLARDRLKQVEFHARERTRAARRGKKLIGVVPPQLTPKDRAVAQETEELRALTKRGMALRPLLEATWDDLRSRLSAGEMIGYLMEPASGKLYRIDAHEWNRNDADVAHVTGWFSIPHAWGNFVGPIVLVQSDFEQRMANRGTQPPPLLTCRGRAAGGSWQASDEEFFEKMACLQNSGKATSTMGAARIVVREEPSALRPNTQIDSAVKRLARSYPKWAKALAANRRRG